ncbi:MAG TPA: tRNA (adenosine(37)-N6)-threonylcarbamoyltransferase complex ATPase subunit type 1 TsaE [Candidatus Saccharimonadales bacterium]|nr:tRNA (adenosine(37)-N6)-threonylcarbamoyltransferase complex ATPase subunit type 1 TsaE [Candidatus Saccharimonadales bacterium]
MNTGKTLQISSTSSAQTEQLAERLGSKLKGGEVIELISDLGGGKTTFVRGLARGFGSIDRVASPTFTISRVYQAGPRTMHHFDFYRLPEAGLIAEELAEVIGDRHCVTVVEWANVVQNVLPPTRLTIELRRTDEEGRMLHIHVPDALAYLVEELQQCSY